MKGLRDLDLNEMARVEGGFASGGDGYCGTVVPGQLFPPPHGPGPDPWIIKAGATINLQTSPVLQGPVLVGKLGGF